MSNKSKNKYQVFADQLREHCRKCRSQDPGRCLNRETVCDESAIKANRLYYDLLHLNYPYGKCILRPACDWRSFYDSFRHYWNMRRVAKCELTGEVIFFAKNKRYFLMGRPVDIDYERIAQIEDFDGTRADLGFTEQYTKEN